MEVIFIVVLYRIWLRVQNASVLIYGSIPALIVSILLVVFNPLTSDVLSPVSYCFALFTELSFLSLAWAAAMVLDRSHLRPGAITCSFLSLLLLSFLIGTTIFPADYQLASIQLVTIFCVIFFIVLVWYAHTQGVQSVRAEQSASISYDAILLQRCNLLSDRYGLSPRERELLPYFVMGMSSSAIGRRQFISQPTVKTHRYRIFQKFGIRSHEELYDLFVAEG